MLKRDIEFWRTNIQSIARGLDAQTIDHVIQEIGQGSTCIEDLSLIQAEDVFNALFDFDANMK